MPKQEMAKSALKAIGIDLISPIQAATLPKNQRIPIAAADHFNSGLFRGSHQMAASKRN
ncbi:MAG: hypothetical protein ACLUKN_15780 [Bacilli bacterium]